jgi:hypothetical protein
MRCGTEDETVKSQLLGGLCFCGVHVGQQDRGARAAGACRGDGQVFFLGFLSGASGRVLVVQVRAGHGVERRQLGGPLLLLHVPWRRRGETTRHALDFVPRLQVSRLHGVERMG